MVLKTLQNLVQVSCNLIIDKRAKEYFMSLYRYNRMSGMHTICLLVLEQGVPMLGFPLLSCRMDLKPGGVINEIGSI